MNNKVVDTISFPELAVHYAVGYQFRIRIQLVQKKRFVFFGARVTRCRCILEFYSDEWRIKKTYALHDTERKARKHASEIIQEVKRNPEAHY